MDAGQSSPYDDKSQQHDREEPSTMNETTNSFQQGGTVSTSAWICPHGYGTQAAYPATSRTRSVEPLDKALSYVKRQAELQFSAELLELQVKIAKQEKLLAQHHTFDLNRRETVRSLEASLRGVRARLQTVEAQVAALQRENKEATSARVSLEYSLNTAQGLLIMTEARRATAEARVAALEKQLERTRAVLVSIKQRLGQVESSK